MLTGHGVCELEVQNGGDAQGSGANEYILRPKAVAEKFEWATVVDEVLVC